MDYTDLVASFAGNYINYCKSNSINIAEVCRGLKSKEINIPNQKLYAWRDKRVRMVSVFTLNELSNAVGKPLKFFLPD